MGNCESAPRDSEWNVVGRNEDIENVKKLLREKKLILIFGQKKIGKTTFIGQIFKEIKGNKICLWKDFELENIDDAHIVYECFIELLTAIDANEEILRFKKKYPQNVIACYSCENCTKHDYDTCVRIEKMIKSEIFAIIAKLKKDGRDIVLFLDNIDKIMDSSLKDNFLHFLKQLVIQTKFRTVTASAIKLKLTLKAFESYELKPLESTAIRHLLFETCECKESDEALNETVHENELYSTMNKVFKPENKQYINVIVRLCEGFPLAAIMSGLLLTEDDGLLTPGDLVEILICMRLTGLSPDNCPPDDRLSIYERSMDEVKDVSSFFNILNEKLTGTKFSKDEAVAVAIEAQEGVGTEAMVKLKVLKKCLDRSILSIKNLSGDQQLTWHGILRECQFALQTLDNIPPGEAQTITKEMVLKFMKENVKKAGLDFDDDILRDPKSLEQAIKGLSIRAPAPVQAEDEKKPMSITDEHYLATKKYGAVHTSSTMKDVTDLESNPDLHSKLTKKLETRYSFSEDNELNFEERPLYDSVKPYNSSIEETKEAENPPPYTPIAPELHGTLTFNADNNIYQHQGNFERSPPPSYHSSTTNKSEDDMYSQNDELKLTYFQRRPRSFSSSHIKINDFKQNRGRMENKEHIIYSRQPNNRNIRQRSDPTCDRLKTDQTEKSQYKPRKEMDISLSESLAGPPAVFNPPNIVTYTQKEGQKISKFEKVDYYAAGMNSKNSNLLLDDLKDDLKLSTDGFEIGTVIDDDSVTGPPDIPYESTFILHGNRHDLHNAGNAQNHKADDQIGLDGDTSNDMTNDYYRLSVNQRDNIRRSPTAIVKSMLRRISPPNVNKQTPSDRPDQSLSQFR